jgi:hypothetical protein
MSLLVWLPLISNTKNKGLSNPTVTTTGTITYSSGKIGNALTFNNSSIILNPAPITTNVTEHSFSFWYKTSNVSATQCLYNGRSTVGEAIGIFLIGGKFRYDDGAQHTFNYSMVANTWVHVTITRDTSNIKLYINGVLNQNMSSSTFTCNSSTASIGLSSTSGATPSGNAIIGQLNDYRIYDHVLSKKEVKEISKGLTIHLPMDWGSGKPNMIKNSYTWMNKATGSNNANSCTITKSVIEDDTAPCFNVLKCSITNSAETAKGSTGIYYAIAAQGLALTDLIEGETYTYSFWAKSDSGIASGLRYDAIIESQTHVSSNGFGTLDSNWRKHTVTFKWTKTTKLTACFYVTVPANSTVDFQLCGIKLEKGDTATPYIPHVNETAYTSRGYANNYKDECSGYNRGITNGGTAVIGEESPRGTGTYCTSGCYLQATSGFPLSSAMPSWTIALWFKPDIGKTFTSWSDVFRFWMNTETGNNTHFRLETQNKSGNNYSLYYNNSGQSSYGGGALTTLTENKWYHLAFCCDSTKIYQYVNSELKITHTINTGYKPTGPTGYFQIGDGGMYASYADVRVYATCLSADDIKELYQVSAQIDKSGNFYCGQLVEV